MFITLYIQKGCPYSHSAYIALEEKRIHFKIINLVEEKYKKMKNIFADNNITLPILKERDTIIYNNEVVMLYIDERYPSPSLLPHYPVERARTRLAMKRIDKEWFSLMNFILSTKNIQKMKEAKIALINSLKAIEPIFAENEFFMSDTMTLADCSLAALLYLFPQKGIFLDEEVLMGHISKYARRIFSRESFKRTLPTILKNT